MTTTMMVVKGKGWPLAGNFLDVKEVFMVGALTATTAWVTVNSPNSNGKPFATIMHRLNLGLVCGGLGCGACIICFRIQ
jgi:hypothetical protein